jgi:ABC-type Zn uptake system ZnuABC Zn-binding protein ZnuA
VFLVPHHRLIALFLALTLAASACGSGSDDADTSSPGDTRLTVVTTVAPITSIAANIIGDRAAIIGVVPEGTNSHTFEPAPSAAELFSDADAIFINGLVLEEPTKSLALANKPDSTPLIELGNESLAPNEYKYDFSFPEDEGKPNPHLWTDPDYALVYAEIIRATMTDIDPDGAAVYQANYDLFVDIVAELDEAMVASFATIPDANRVLLTYHDAYAYFAENYGFTVIGAIQPADFGEPSPQEVAALIDQVRDTGVPAIFGSEVFPSPILDQIADEAGGTFVDTLRDDDLPGAPGESEHSWVGLMRSNYITMTSALGGDPDALEALTPRNVTTDEADYPQ